MRRTRIVEGISHLKIWLGNGQGYISDFKYPVLLAVFLKEYLPEASNITLGLIALLGMGLMAFVGWFDMKYIKLAQTLADIHWTKYNPAYARLLNGKS